jgi:hypothetical protein
MTGELLFTKTIVQKRDIRGFQKALFAHGFGYELALDKDFSFRKFKGQQTAFFIDPNGMITFIEDYNDNDDNQYREYITSSCEEISWDYYFDGLGAYA